MFRMCFAKKIFFILLTTIVLLSQSACSNKTKQLEISVANNNLETIEETNQNTDNKENKNTMHPTVISNLFDGKQKIWFYLDNEELAYDTEVAAILVTKNKKVINIYYNLVDPGYGGSSASYCISEDGPHPLSCERFNLEDFAGLSDDEIIKKVSQSYGDASSSYSLTYNYVDRTETFSLPSLAFPHEIKYRGELDSSGNRLINEELSLAQSTFLVNIGEGSFRYMAKVNCESFEIDTIIKPTEIKDKQYIGFKNEDNYMLVTVNKFYDFDDIKYDDPSGITEW